MAGKKVTTVLKLRVPQRSSLAAELKKFKTHREAVLQVQWDKNKTAYNKLYQSIKVDVLTKLGALELAEKFGQITGNRIWGGDIAGAWIYNDSIAGISIKERLEKDDIKDPGESPTYYHYHRGTKKYSSVIETDYENARQHIMFDEPLTVAGAFEIIEAFKTGKPIPEFVPPMVRLLGGYLLPEKKLTSENSP